MPRLTKGFLAAVMTLLLAFAAAGCMPRQPREITNCFYYWRPAFHLDTADLKTLNTLHVKRLYVKFFDVIWSKTDNRPVPVASVSFASKPPAALEIVPTVFITNTALRLSTPDSIADLAAKIQNKLDYMRGENGLPKPSEIQLDCDWTAETRDRFFSLLRNLREGLTPGTVLSATLRLHQIKYAKTTGVPPVDRGMLMFYNFQAPNQINVNNAILDLKVGKSYTGGLASYPLPLDVALPIFSWGALFDGDRLISLIDGLRPEEIANSRLFWRESGSNRYLALKDGYLRNVRIHQGDLLRLDMVDYPAVRAAVEHLRNRLKPGWINVAIFHFDTQSVEGFGNAAVAKVFAGFR